MRVSSDAASDKHLLRRSRTGYDNPRFPSSITLPHSLKYLVYDEYRLLLLSVSADCVDWPLIACTMHEVSCKVSLQIYTSRG